MKKLLLPILLSFGVAAQAQPQVDSKYLKDGAVTGTKIAPAAVDLSTHTTGVLPVNKGGTGQTSSNNSLNAILPNQTGQSGKALVTDGTNTSWGIVANSNGAAGRVQFSDGSAAFLSDAEFVWDNSTKKFKIGTAPVVLGTVPVVGIWTPTNVNGIVLGSETGGAIGAVLMKTHANGAIIQGVQSGDLDTNAPLQLQPGGSDLKLGQAGHIWPNTDGSNGQVLSTDGSGNLAFISGGGGGANTSLSNLTGVAVNTDLLPAGGQSLGSSGFPWANQFLSGRLKIGSGPLVGTSPLTVYFSGGSTNGVYMFAGTNPSDIGFAVESDGTSINFQGTNVGLSAAVPFRLNQGGGDLLLGPASLKWPAVDGTSGQVLSTNGSGVLSFITPSGGATTALDNLASTAVNANILPDTNSTWSLGSSSLRWAEVFTDSVKSTGVLLFSSASGIESQHIHQFDAGIKLYDNPNGFGITHIAPTLGANYTLTWPVDNGTPGQSLTTDGSGVLSWATSGVSFPLLGSDGSAAAPTYSFTNATTSGMWHGGSGNLIFTVNGTNVFATAPGVVVATGGGIALGTVGTPWSQVVGAGFSFGTGNAGLLKTEDASGTTQNLVVRAGDSGGSGNAGTLIIRSGANSGSNSTGAATFQSGDHSGVGSGVSGIVTIRSGNGTSNGSGAVNISTGAAAGNRGFINLDSAGVTTVGPITPTTNNAVDLGSGANNWRIVYGRLFLGNVGTPSFGSDFNTGLASSFESGSSNTSANVNTVTLRSGDNLGGSTGTAGSVIVKSGNISHAANANNTGDVSLMIGTTTGAGARGKIKFVDGSEGTVGHVWTQTNANGSGAWQAGGGGGTLANNTYFNARNAANNADIGVFKVNASDVIEIGDGYANISVVSPMSVGGVQFRDGTYIATMYAPPSSLTGDYSLVLPVDDGTPGQVLSTDGSGVLSWLTGVSTSLNNLASVAINTDLVFGTTVAGVIKTFDEASGATPNMTVTTGTPAVNEQSGALILRTANATGTGAGGDVQIQAGSSDDGPGGNIYMSTSSTLNDGTIGTVLIQTGSPGLTNNGGPGIQLKTGDGFGTGSTANISLVTGNVGGGTAPSGEMTFATGDSVGGASGNMTFITGNVMGGTRGYVNVAAPFMISSSAGIRFGTGFGGAIQTWDEASGPTGALVVRTGTPTTGDSGITTITTGGSADANTGDTEIQTGASAGGNSGNVRINTGSATGTKGKVIIEDDTEFKAHIIVNQTATTTAAPGPDSGTGATCVLESGSSDTAGQIQLTTGTGAAPGELCTVTFGTSFPNKSFCTLTAANADAGGFSWWVTSDSGDFQLRLATSPADATAYNVNYHCIGQ